MKLSEFKGIVFDLDDTLIDRKDAYNKVFSNLYNQYTYFQKNFLMAKLCVFFGL